MLGYDDKAPARMPIPRPIDIGLDALIDGADSVLIYPSVVFTNGHPDPTDHRVEKRCQVADFDTVFQGNLVLLGEVPWMR